MSQDRIRKLKKGEVLIKEGDASENLFFVQSGKFQAWIERGPKKFDMGQTKPQQIIGDTWIFTTTKSPFTYVALQESTVLEMPLATLKAQMEQSPATLKLVFKSIGEDLKTFRQSFKSERLENDPTPMPTSQMARSLTLLHMGARHLGKPDGILMNVDWGLLSKFLQKFFTEPTSRLKQWILLFKKMGILSYEVRTGDEGEEEFGRIQFMNLQFVEDFAEFYQHYYFKNPAHETLHYDPIPAKAAKVMVELGEGLPVDHKKFTAVDMKDILERFKALTGGEFKTTHFDHLERKGLFVKRQTLADGRLMISFDHSEFKKLSAFWEVIFEVNEWNQNGFVNMTTPEAQAASTAGQCPSCKSNVNESNKFCPECGLKLAA